ncbi:peripheral protein of the cytosolic face of the outer membrane, Mdv1p [Trichosporon asahii var. asahii CBS 2479]|uniref:Peripheral protein of the cytosolic face of the outer membrane, Mdv1p n=1 Tax=Trichosporon asahii var. asahii (strain ATCC 90039 / CBS 2479 / JCM 2466 / KCTC 7840 / NBRC 103889/ NCYC 2677 / UAMH 7654) TaxID=1186058 RepID=J6EUV9_TRIAS|nr:peripheral protein of the cytosolic face of the outer membrane, Mdv1p [Trichosporon asahii var. asahii CBS 2479]EJT46557.1 peripheral protein of the cytosolic face of the outer membrane, Mdv1p [Trichosporon asahii var. asahii CBS 2479]
MGPVQPTSSTGIQILERADALTRLSLDDEAPTVSLIRGFKATIPTSELSKQRRRLIRGGLVDEDLGGKLGLKALGDRARGLLTDGSDEIEAQHEAKRKDKRSRRKKLRERRSTMAHLEGKLHLEDLLQQADEIAQDKDNLAVRQSLINAEINEVSSKIEQLAEIRKRLEASLLKLQEEGLELDDELEGIQELMASPSVTSAAGVKALPPSAQQTVSSSSRRRKGPAFLPSEHDELPSGVAFLTLEGHTAPLTALDYDEPYGTLVTAGQDDAVKVWDLCDGEVLGELRGHKGAVKAVQVEDTLCVTGGEDGDVRLWDLRLVEDYEEKLAKAAESRNPLDRIAEEKEGSIRQGGEEEEERNPCVRTLEGHSKSITALYYEDSTLVTGSADKTIRQWDVTTGQCVQTMDILWAISNPPVIPLSPRKSRRKYSSSSYASAGYDDLLPSLDSPGAVEEPISLSGPFSVPTPPFSDGSWDMYTDFVGGLQFWGYALASGSGDGAVRMWDMRTGQAHRTLNGHTAPVTSLQFDEHNIISGSLDKTIRIWDMRMGQTAELHKYEYPVTCVQFDSRKVVACTGENGIEVYNRTTHEHSRLIVNGHTKPAERMRFIDKYLVSGGKDGTAKVWAM